MRGLADDRLIIIKQADKGSCIVVWDRNDYLAEGYKQINNSSTYIEINNFKEINLADLVEKSNTLFRKLYSKKSITEKEMKYFTYSFKKSSSLGKLYILPKIHKRFQDVPGCPVISNCGTPTEKASEFLDYHLQSYHEIGQILYQR